MYTIKSFCKEFGITRPTFYEWEKKGIVLPMRIGKTVRIEDAEVARIKEKYSNNRKEN